MIDEKIDEAPVKENSKDFRSVLSSRRCQETCMVGTAILEEACDRLDAQRQEMVELQNENARLSLVVNNLKSSNRALFAEKLTGENK